VQVMSKTVIVLLCTLNFENIVLYTVLSLFNLSRMVLKLVSVFVVNKLNAQ